MSNTPLRILFFSESPREGGEIQRALTSAGYSPELRQTASTRDLKESLIDADFDILLVDCRSPRESVLRLLREYGGNRHPFIALGQSLSEDWAVSVMRAGAEDIVLEDNLGRLKPAVERILEARRTAGANPSADPTPPLDSEAILRALLDESVDSVYLKDIHGRYLLLNQAGARFLGKSLEEIIGNDDTRVFSQETAEKVRASDRAVLLSGKTRIYEDALTTLDGTRRYFQAMKVVYRDRAGIVRGVMGIVRNITERRQAEEALKALEQELSTIFHSVPTMIWYKDRENRFLRVNKSAAESVGMKIEDIEGKSADEIFPFDAEKYYRDELEVMRSGVPQLGVVESCRLPGGAMRWLSTDKIPYRNERGEIVGVILYAMDITRLRETETALRISQENYQELYLWERRTREAVQTLRESLDARDTYAELVRLAGSVLNVDRAFVIQTEGEMPLPIEYEFVRNAEVDSVLALPPMSAAPDVEEVLFEQGGTPGYPGFLAIEDTAACGRLPEAVHRIILSHQARAFVKVPIVYENRRLSVLILHSLTPRVWRERELYFLKTVAHPIAVNLYHAELMREVNRATNAKSMFLANMSHEFRTPLNAVIGYAEMLENGMAGELNEKQAKYAHHIATSGRHLLLLVNDILDLSKVESGMFTLAYNVFPLRSALEEVLHLLHGASEKKGVNLNVWIAPQIDRIRADQTRFKQILYNLLSNAVKFTNSGGMVSIRAEPDGEQTLVLTVQDTGIGIADSDRDRIFLEFVQLDNSYARKQDGTGLGLALTKRFVELHNGTIDFDSQVDVGTTFFIRMPCLCPSSAEVSLPPPA